MADDRTDSSDELGVRLGRPPEDALSSELMRKRLCARMFGEPEAPPQIARFRVLEPIGRGGMGSVYLARDEALTRSVALKFLHRAGDRGELLAEAQALARLAHPNVVSVYDVGVHEGRVWLAMEYVPGQTLHDWQREGPARDELLARWIAAGRGLAAVHEAGLIHRDVKPDNVLLGVDGRVRLIDFGLVIANHAVSSRSGSGPGCGSDQGGERSESTRRGRFAGTPAYAAPEQRVGAAVDERSDQYAYCVSVWEALAGQRPVRDEAGVLLAPDLSHVPRRVVAALRRGLAADPCDRWPSMLELLAAIAPRRRRVDLVAAIAIAIAAGLAIGFGSRDAPAPAPAPDRCSLAAAGLDTSAASVLAEGPLRGSVEQWIDDWQQTARRSCEDFHVRGQVSEAALTQRSACLEYRRFELLGLLDHLSHVQRGRGSLETGRLELGDPQACLRGSDEALALPTEHATEIAELRSALAELERRAGDRARSLIPEAEQLLAQARVLAWPPTIAEAALTLAQMHQLASDPEPARELLGEVLDLGQAHRQTELAARAWSITVTIAYDLELDPEAALWAWQRERAALELLGSTALDRGRLAKQRGQIAWLSSDMPGAERALLEAIEQFEQAGLSGRLQLMSTLDRLAFVVGSAGRTREMQGLGDRARALELELESSPTVPQLASEADEAFNAGQAALAAGDHATALAQLERSLAGYARSSGPESQHAAQLHVALAQVLDAMGSLDQAERHARRADDILLARLSPNHPLRTSTLSALGTIALRRGDHGASVRAFRLALHIEQTRPGGGGADTALARSNLAEALIVAKEETEARWQAELALTELRASLSATHPDLAYPHKALGWALLEVGELEAARLHLSRALELQAGWAEIETREIQALLARAK